MNRYIIATIFSIAILVATTGCLFIHPYHVDKQSTFYTIENRLRKSISIHLLVYKLLPNGSKKLIYDDKDPPTKNLFELMLGFLGENDVTLVTTSGVSTSQIYHVASEKICVGTGSSTNPYSTTNLISNLTCTSDVITNFTETNNYAVAIIKGLMFFSSTYTITEVGYIVSYHSNYLAKSMDILMLYDNVNINVSPSSPLLIEYVINVSYTPPLTQSYWHAVLYFGLGLGSPPFGADVIYFDSSKIDVYFCPYFSYSSTATTSNLPSTCISGYYVLALNSSQTTSSVSISYWLSPPSQVNLGTIALVIEIYRTYWSSLGWETGYVSVLSAISPISSSNSVVLSWSEWMKLNVEVRVG